MKYALHALHERNIAGVGDLEQSLAAQHPVAEGFADEAPPPRDAGPGRRLRENEAIGADVCVVPLEMLPVGMTVNGNESLRQSMPLAGGESHQCGGRVA